MASHRSNKTGVIGIVAKEQQLLVIRRSAYVRKPLKLCFPGGTMDDGEPEEKTLVREFREELGLTVTPVRRLVETFSPWGTRLLFWEAELSSMEGLMIDPYEVAEMMWMTVTDLHNHPDLLESNIEILEMLRNGKLELNGLQS